MATTRKQSFLNQVKHREDFFLRVAQRQLQEWNAPDKFRDWPEGQQDVWEFQEYLWELWEAIVVAIYHSVERQLRRMLQCRKTPVECGHRWEDFKAKYETIGISFSTLSSSNQFDLIRLLVNSIKHQGEPNNDLAGKLPLSKKFDYMGLLTHHDVRQAFIRLIDTKQYDYEKDEHDALLRDVLFHCRTFLVDLVNRMDEEDLTKPSNRANMFGRRLKTVSRSN